MESSDKKKWWTSPFVRQCWVTGAVSFNIVGHGTAIGYPAVLLPQLADPHSTLKLQQYHYTWIASVMTISLMVGNFVTPPISERFGRKMAHFAVTVPIILGWFLFLFAHSFEALMIARTLQGLSFGMLLPLRSALIGEYTSPKNRGAFLTMVALSQAFGIFFVHLMGSLMSWQRTALVCVFFSFASFIMTMYIPESPSFLAAKGKFDKCRKAFYWLRDAEEEDELEEMIRICLLVEKEGIKDSMANKKSSGDIFKTIKKRVFHRPLILMSHAYFMSQFAGGTLMATYSTNVISLVMGPGYDSHFWMVVLDTQRIISNVAAVYVINKIGRRIMMFSTGALCAISYLAIAAFVYMKQRNILTQDYPWLAVILLNVQYFTVAVGMVPLPSVIAGEVFPLEYRSIGSSLSIIPLAASMFAAIKTYPSLVESVGLQGTFTVYAVILTYCLCVLWVMLPETKDKTLQQIEDEFRGKPLTADEMEVRRSLQHDPVENYKRKQSVISYCSQI